MLPSGHFQAEALGDIVVIAAENGVSTLQDDEDIQLFAGPRPAEFVAGPERVYFRVDTESGSAVWSTDGSVAGTRPLYQTVATTMATPKISDLTVLGNYAYFLFDDDGERMRWRTGATLDITAPFLPTMEDVTPIAATDDLTLFVYLEEATELDEARSLKLGVLTDTVQGEQTSVVQQLRGNYVLPTLGSPVWSRDVQAVIDDTLYYVSSFEPSNDFLQLWATDGTHLGTRRVRYDDCCYKLFALNETLVSSGGSGFWASDGTQAGIRLGEWPGLFDGIAIDDHLVLLTTNGVEVYHEGTTDLLVVEEIDDDHVFVDSQHGADALYFVTRDLDWTQTVWRTDGTATGTYSVQMGEIGGAGGEVRPIAVDEGILLEAGDGLVFSDATAAGTRLILDDESSLPVQPDDPNHFFSQAGFVPLGSLNDDYLFLVRINEHKWDEVSGTRVVGQHEQLWRSDGTMEGTYAITDLQAVPGATVFGAPQVPRWLQAVGSTGRVVFPLTGEHGTELWVTDGTQEATFELRDINPGSASGLTVPFDYFNLGGVEPNVALFDDHVFFSADDGENGAELWMTDGTPEGTVLVADINPGAASSSPGSFQIVNGALLFQADDGIHGVEWHRYVPDNKQYLRGDANLDGEVNFADFLVLSSNFARTIDAVWEDGDFNGDNNVNFADFLLLSQHFGARS